MMGIYWRFNLGPLIEINEMSIKSSLLNWRQKGSDGGNGDQARHSELI